MARPYNGGKAGRDGTVAGSSHGHPQLETPTPTDIARGRCVGGVKCVADVTRMADHAHNVCPQCSSVGGRQNRGVGRWVAAVVAGKCGAWGGVGVAGGQPPPYGMGHRGRMIHVHVGVKTGMLECPKEAQWH